MYRLPTSHFISPRPPLSALGKGQWAGPGISRVGQLSHCHWLLLWLLLPALLTLTLTLWTLENATYSKVPQRLTSTTWRTTGGGAGSRRKALGNGRRWQLQSYQFSWLQPLTVIRSALPGVWVACISFAYRVLCIFKYEYLSTALRWHQ